MKKVNLNPFLRSIIFCLFFSNLMLPLTASSDKDFIKKNLNLLGFTIMKVNSLNSGYYQLTLSSFSPRGPLTLKGSFKPFAVNVKVQSGKLWLQKTVFQKNRYVIHEIKLPGTIILKDFILPPPENVPPEFTSSADRVLRRMNIYHGSAKKYSKKVHSKIRKIRQQARRAYRVVSDCSPSQPVDTAANSVMTSEESLPDFGDLMGRPFRIYSPADSTSCDVYLKNVEEALNYAGNTFAYILEILKSVNKIKAWVDERCGDGCCIKETDKNSIKNHLTVLLRAAEAAESEFGGYRDDITRFIKEYRECWRKKRLTQMRKD